MEFIEKDDNITKISQVTPEVALFLRQLGFSNYYIIKIFALVGDAAIALTEDNPYWLLDEFPNMKFETADKAAFSVGVERNSFFRIEAAIKHGLSSYINRGHTFVPAREFCLQIGQFLDLSSESVEDVMEDMALAGDLQLTVLDGQEVLYFYGYYKTECMIVRKIAEMTGEKPKTVAANVDAVIRKAESEGDVALSAQQRDAVKNSLGYSVSIITGGPGTGKTVFKSSEWRFPLIFQGFSGYSTKIAPPFNHKNGGTLSTHGRGKCGIYNAQKVFGLIILHLRIDVHSCLAVFMPRKILNCLWINASIQKIGNVGMP